MIAFPKQKATRLRGKAYQRFRKEVFEAAEGICQDCGAYAPLYDEDGVFDVFSCGHVSHDKSRGSGGQDIASNARWKCPTCHLKKEHGPKWSSNGGTR